MTRQMTHEARGKELARVNAIAPSLRQLATEAWSDAASMQVFVDRLLEEGQIQMVTADESESRCTWYGPDHSHRDDALYRLECDAREWILRLYTDPFELRVTGAWPEILFVVYRNHGGSEDATLSDRVEFIGTVKQPRLLRVMVTGGTER